MSGRAAQGGVAGLAAPSAGVPGPAPRVDLVAAAHLDLARKTVTRLNPRAITLATTHSNAPLEKMLLTGLYDNEKTSSGAAWLQLLRGGTNDEEERPAKRGKKTSLKNIASRSSSSPPL